MVVRLFRIKRHTKNNSRRKSQVQICCLGGVALSLGIEEDMKISNGKIDLYRVQSTTDRNNHQIERAIETAERLKADTDRQDRLSALECKCCHYIHWSRMGGAAITETNCAYCQKSMTFGSTAVDYLCKDCAKELGLCKQCGGDLEGKIRRKIERIK